MAESTKFDLIDFDLPFIELLLTLVDFYILGLYKHARFLKLIVCINLIAAQCASDALLGRCKVYFVPLRK
jgi:hypothetical protein